MLLALSDGVVRVGCTAEILEVIKTYEDGRMDIITVGRDPFRVTQLLDDEPLLLGDVDYLEDCEMQDLSAKIAGPSRQRQLVELFETCHTLLYSSLPRDFEAESNGKLSYSIASMLPLDLMWKQQVLELRSEEERQERLLAYLREWAPHLQRQGALRHRAAGNGHGFN
jgi:Lon protease-like protein